MLERHPRIPVGPEEFDRRLRHLFEIAELYDPDVVDALGMQVAQRQLDRLGQEQLVLVVAIDHGEPARAVTAELSKDVADEGNQRRGVEPRGPGERIAPPGAGLRLVAVGDRRGNDAIDATRHTLGDRGREDRVDAQRQMMAMLLQRSNRDDHDRT